MGAHSPTLVRRDRRDRRPLPQVCERNEPRPAFLEPSVLAVPPRTGLVRACNPTLDVQMGTLVQVREQPALDGHNYAKSPLMEAHSPAASSSSTDTASEAGSAFNSPVRASPPGGASQPVGAAGGDLDRLVVVRLGEEHPFAPHDLLALLKTVEAEIGACEAALRDELDRRRKYVVSPGSLLALHLATRPSRCTFFGAVAQGVAVVSSSPFSILPNPRCF